MSRYLHKAMGKLGPRFEYFMSRLASFGASEIETLDVLGLFAFEMDADGITLYCVWVYLGNKRAVVPPLLGLTVDTKIHMNHSDTEAYVDSNLGTTLLIRLFPTPTQEAFAASQTDEAHAVMVNEAVEAQRTAMTEADRMAVVAQPRSLRSRLSTSNPSATNAVGAPAAEAVSASAPPPPPREPHDDAVVVGNS